MATSSSAAEQTWHLPPIGGLVTLLSGEFASRALSFAAIAVLTRRLGVVGWAPVAVALTTLQFGALFVESGMRLYGAREVARDTSNGARLMGPVLSTQLALAVLVLIGAVAVRALGLVEPDLARLLPGYAVSLFMLPLFVPWVFQGYGDMQWVAIPQVVRYAVFLVLSALLVTSPARTGFLPWLETAAMAAGAGVALVALRRHRAIAVRVTPASAFDRDVLREATPIAASQMVWVLRMYLPTLFLWHLATKRDVAQFDVSLRVLMVLQAFLTMYLMNLYTPLSQAAHGDRARFRGLLTTSTVLAGVLAVVGAIILGSAPGRLLGLLFGGAYNNPDAAASLALLAFVVPVLTVRGHAHYALTSLGYQRRELLCTVAGSALLVVLLIAWAANGGARAAALAMLLSESLGLLLTWIALALAMRSDGFAAGARGAEP